MSQENGFLNKISLMNKVISRNGKLGSDACEILSAAIHAVDPYTCTFERVHLYNRKIFIDQNIFDLNQFKRVFLIGFGKAAVPMASAVIDKLGSILFQSTVITKDPKFLAENGLGNKLSVYLGGHPLPSSDSINSTQLLLYNLPEMTQEDLVIVVISGGGSALFTNPVRGVTLDDLQALTQILLKSGADIEEINTLRKHLDQMKGGGLAVSLQPASVATLILSDVIGDRLDVIASGPTVPDPTTYQDAIDVLDRYAVLDQVPLAILSHLEKGRDGLAPETLKPGQIPTKKNLNLIVGTNFHAAEAALIQAKALGYHASIITSALTGLTEHVAGFIAGIAYTALTYDQPVSRPACIIFGGEPTVNVTGDGLGGRNMDLALKLVPRLAEKHGVLFISFASDGEDGPTDAAGAAIDGAVFREGMDVFGLDINDYINNNDSYHYHESLGGLIKTGATGTNVNDLMLLLIG